MTWIDVLPERRRRGSYPRCLLLMEGNKRTVARRLTELIALEDVQIPDDAIWMPRGIPYQKEDGSWDFSPANEAKLSKSEGFLTLEQKEQALDWWLEVILNANTPNWDVASTCRIDGKPGLLLIEAKAHSAELSAAVKTPPSSPNGEKNDCRIRAAISEANDALNRILPGWRLSCDSHYQISNRFAWAWKLTSLGIPVVLIYLGFIQATEMADRGKPFMDGKSWEETVLKHSRGIAPSPVWDSLVCIDNTSMQCCIRSIHIPFPNEKPGESYDTN